MTETTNAIIEASTLPLSILIVGIGKEASGAMPAWPPGLWEPMPTAAMPWMAACAAAQGCHPLLI